MIIPRATPAQIQATFNPIDPDKLDGSDSPILNIGVSASALLASDYNGEGGLAGYLQHMRDNRDVPQEDGMAANLVKSFLDCNYINPNKRAVVKVGVYTLMSDETLPRLHTSFKRSGYEDDIGNGYFNFHQIDEGGDPKRSIETLAKAIHDAEIDFFVASHIEVAEHLNLMGIGACVLMNPGTVTPYDPLETRWYATDGDGALWSDHFESVFQRIYQEVGGDLEATIRKYYDYVVETAENPMAVGPAFKLFQKLSQIKSALRHDPDLKDILKTKLVTTRDFRGALPFQAFAEAFKLHFNLRNFVSGSPKNSWLKGAILFAEDDTTHLERTLKMSDNERPKTHAYLPHGIKHEMRKKGQAVISEAQHLVKNN